LEKKYHQNERNYKKLTKEHFFYYNNILSINKVVKKRQYLYQNLLISYIFNNYYCMNIFNLNNDDNNLLMLLF